MIAPAAATSYVPRDRVSLLVGVGTNPTEYEAHRERGGDLFEVSHPGSQTYRDQVLAPFAGLRGEWEPSGMRLATGLTPSRVREIASESDVLILISHSTKGRVQIDGEMLPVEDFAAMLPEDRPMVVDLTACATEEFGWGVKHLRPGCTFKYAQRKLDPDVAFGFYETMARTLGGIFPPYFDVFRIAAEAFLAANQDVG